MSLYLQVTLRFEADYEEIAEGKELYFAGMLHNRFLDITFEYQTLMRDWEVMEGEKVVIVTLVHELFYESMTVQ